MSDPLRGVVVSHATLAEALVEAVRQIVGDDHGLVAVSNDACSSETLGERVKAAVGSRPAVVFVDLPGGSCLHAAAKCMHDDSGIAVVSGVSLAMLVDFVYHRDATPAEAATRAYEAGGRALKVLTA